MKIKAVKQGVLCVSGGHEKNKEVILEGTVTKKGVPDIRVTVLPTDGKDWVDSVLLSNLIVKK
jgi:hypothetical protein